MWKIQFYLVILTHDHLYLEDEEDGPQTVWFLNLWMSSPHKYETRQMVRDVVMACFTGNFETMSDAFYFTLFFNSVSLD
jgi:hypothetical protein